MTLKENLALIENLPYEELNIDTLKSADHVLGKMLGDLPLRGEPMIDSSCCCCCTPCCSCSAAVEDHPFE